MDAKTRLRYALEEVDLGLRNICNKATAKSYYDSACSLLTGLDKDDMNLVQVGLDYLLKRIDYKRTT
jgi:hypothetical protein